MKFLFATTEVQKVPVTVLSRCQRFDLRRISAELLAAHFGRIAEAEAVAIEQQALILIARAAEGSVRDGLSILDQAIAHADLAADDGPGVGVVTADQVRGMLGLSDRGALRSLFDRLMDGDALSVLRMLGDQVDLGVDPGGVLRGLLEIVHATTVAKSGAPADPSQSAEERETFERWASGLSFAVLHRLWQLLLKGHDEVSRASDPHEAADMALLRIVHASQLPDPATVLKRLESSTSVAVALPSAPAGPEPIGPPSFAALIERIEAAGKHQMGHQLREDVGLVRYAPPALVIRPIRPVDLVKLARELREATGMAWEVTSDDAPAALSLREQDLAAEAAARDAVLADPMVQATLAQFPEAELIGWTDKRSMMQ